MDIRSPDSYKTEALVDSPPSSQDPSCHELEMAMLQSMEEAWAKEAVCAARWVSFQPFLERLKRIGYYEPEFRRIYDLLTIHLYKYAYEEEDSMSDETLHWIERKLKTVRVSHTEREELDKAFQYLSTQPSFVERSSTQPSFVERSSTQPSFVERSSTRLHFEP